MISIYMADFIKQRLCVHFFLIASVKFGSHILSDNIESKAQAIYKLHEHRLERLSCSFIRSMFKDDMIGKASMKF